MLDYFEPIYNQEKTRQPELDSTSNPMNIYNTMVPATIAPNVKVDVITININESNVTLTLSWGEPFNNFDPIVNYTVSCSGDVTCPPNFTTIDNTTRSYTITNLTTMTNYTFSVVATNSIGSREAGLEMITTPPGENMYNLCCYCKNNIAAMHHCYKLLYTETHIIRHYDDVRIIHIYIKKLCKL